MIKVQKVYYYECKVSGYSSITTDVDKARTGEGFRLASIAEIKDFVSLGFEPIKVVECSDGVYGWYELEYINGLGDEECFSDYIFLENNTDWNIKNMRNLINRIK